MQQKENRIHLSFVELLLETKFSGIDIIWGLSTMEEWNNGSLMEIQVVFILMEKTFYIDVFYSTFLLCFKTS